MPCSSSVISDGQVEKREKDIKGKHGQESNQCPIPPTDVPWFQQRRDNTLPSGLCLVTKVHNAGRSHQGSTQKGLRKDFQVDIYKYYGEKRSLERTQGKKNKQTTN